ncbi:hypothetical protein [Bradyrhizobium sp. JYMT SZCCT0428]|uniref:hypothetical protein n=1 Tax=Bradyrhizobium sp. JYMT SZCCT0428 TaxID=2807673 RepID=UPI001BA47416|nr:hypothetical protein [Bradyrhizobium sp. JYMT SZCCT0428]MBR1156134.1 hypothetical protein [Bradyrhizobium sp. JYMT SZCCT0428]
MVKVLSGLVAAIVIAVGGFFGFQFYTQHRIASELDAALEQIRAAGGKASRGKVSFDLLSRTVTIVDLSAQSAAHPPASVKIGSLTASGVSQPDAARFSAENIEIADAEIGATMGTMSLSYKLSRITVKDYSGPASLQQPPASSSFVDVYRSVLEQFTGVTATSITAPSLTATMNQGVATPGGGEVAYTGLAIQGIKDGKIASTKIDAVIFTANTQPPTGKPDKLTGNLANVAGFDIDINAVAAIFDPQKAGDDQYYRVYRQITAGPYVITSGQGPVMRIDSIIADDVGLRPSRIQLQDLLALIPPPGAAPPTPAQTRALIEKVAKVYEGIRIGNAEMRGSSVEMPDGQLKFAAMRFNLDSGKVNEFAIEGVDGRTPQGPFKLGRFALKSLDVANLMRMSALFSNPSQQPPPDQALGMLALIEGVELKALAAPFKDTGRPVNIDAFNLDWGNFIGPIPSKLRLALKMAAPLDARDPGQKVLVTAGLDKAAIDFDLGAAWTEASRAFALEPVTLDIGGIAKASLRVALANVPRGVFSPNAVQAATMAGQIEAGTIDLTLRDTGGIDLAVAQYARLQNVSREAARSAIVEGIRSGSEQAAATNPDAVAAVEAVARFVESPGQTLNIKLTPLGKVPAMQLMQLLKTDPMVALAQFRIEASTGL